MVCNSWDWEWEWARQCVVFEMVSVVRFPE